MRRKQDDSSDDDDDDSNDVDVEKQGANNNHEGFTARRRRRRRRRPRVKCTPLSSSFLTGVAVVLLCYYFCIMRQADFFLSLPPDSKNCHTISPLLPPHLEVLTPERRQRYDAVRQAIQHAWKGYADKVESFTSLFFSSEIPPDDASPLSHSAHSWLNYAATLHDALDTLYLAQLGDEYQKAVLFLLHSDFQTTSYHPTKTFEYSLRIVGGLLGAFSVSGDARLLTQAQRAADALLEGPFQSSPTVLPRMFDMLAPTSQHNTNNPFSILWICVYRLYASLYRWGRDAFTNEHHFQSLAGVGSFLEFSYLSTVTGNEKYRQASDAIFHHVAKYQDQQTGMIPTSWNVMTGKALNRPGMLGSGADSFYEYLIKQPVLNGCTTVATQQQEATNFCSATDQAMLALYQTVLAKAIRPKHVFRTTTTTIIYPSKLMHNVSFPVDQGSRFHHLLCFVPGMIALGAKELKNSKTTTTTTTRTSHEDDFQLAQELAEGCHMAYQGTKTGLAPEQANVQDDGQLLWSGGSAEYLLRPEYVESLFVLYRLTHDARYQEMGWHVFQSLEQFCRVEDGYAGLKNVDRPPSKEEGSSSSEGRIDDTPSYFLAETLKYLLLLFGPDDYLDLNDFVLTTEAHPLRRAGTYTSPLCATTTTIGAPIPIPGKLLLVVFLTGCLLVLIATGARHLYQRLGKTRHKKDL